MLCHWREASRRGSATNTAAQGVMAICQIARATHCLAIQLSFDWIFVTACVCHMRFGCLRLSALFKHLRPTVANSPAGHPLPALMAWMHRLCCPRHYYLPAFSEVFTHCFGPSLESDWQWLSLPSHTALPEWSILPRAHEPAGPQAQHGH